MMDPPAWHPSLPTRRQRVFERNDALIPGLPWDQAE